MPLLSSSNVDAELRALDTGIRALRDLPEGAPALRSEHAVRRLAARIGEAGALPAWLLSDAPTTDGNPAFDLVGQPTERELEAMVPFALRLGTARGGDGATLPFFVPFLGQGHVVLRARSGAHQEDLLHAALLRVLTTFPPARVRYVVLDAAGTGAGIGDFARFTARGSVYTGGEARAAVSMILEAMRRNAMPLGPRDSLLAFNARGPRALRPYWVFAVRGIDRLIGGTRDGSGLEALFRDAPRLGCAVLATAGSNVRIQHASVFHVDSDRRLLHHKRSRVPLLGEGRFCRDLDVRLDAPLPREVITPLLHQISALPFWGGVGT